MTIVPSIVFCQLTDAAYRRACSNGGVQHTGAFEDTENLVTCSAHVSTTIFPSGSLIAYPSRP
jgi:hypothetical protein